MHITTINNSQTHPSFQGTVDKSVTKYLDNSLKIYKKNVINSRSLNTTNKIGRYEELITKTKSVLDKFMSYCHPDTKLTLKNSKVPTPAKELVIENRTLPTSPSINASKQISIRFQKNNHPINAEILETVISSFEKELSATSIDRNLLRFAMNNLETKANIGWFHRIIAEWQLKKLEKFSMEINTKK